MVGLHLTHGLVIVMLLGTELLFEASILLLKSGSERERGVCEREIVERVSEREVSANIRKMMYALISICMLPPHNHLCWY